MGTSTVASRLRFWRCVIFAGTWLAYAGFYLTRKNYAIAQLEFTVDLNLLKEQVGIITTSYLTAYAIGQFANGVLGDLLGARRMLVFGLVLTGAMSACLGFSSSIPAMAIFFGINGYAQSAGWPAVAKAMTAWNPIESRGRIMGWWGTSYPVGDAVSTALATFLLFDLGLHWRFGFWIPAGLVLGLAVVIGLMVRNRPHDVGLPSHASGSTRPVDPDEAPRNRDALPSPPKPAITVRNSLQQITRPAVLGLGMAYFALKFVRYTFIFWLGFFLVEHLAFPVREAGYLQVPIPLFGVAGVIASGWISDRFSNARRAPIAVLMLIGLTAGLLALLVVPGSYWIVFALLGMIGFFLYGPDMLVAGTAAMDFGSEHAAARVAGFVNGMGSIGAAVQGFVIGWIATTWGWTPVLYVLIGMIVACTGVTATLWTQRGEG